MKSNTSPEEKLLRLIKGQKRQDAIGMDNKSPLKVANSQPKIKHSVYSLTQRYLSFLGIRRIVSFALVVSCIYLAISFIYPFVGLNKIKLPQITLKENTNELKMEPAFDMKPYESYLQEIRKRQIFSSVPIQEMEKPVSGVNLDLIKDISLVGIILGENTQVVIEDKKMQRTFYLSKGQFIGEFQVEDIQKGKVILNYKGQRFELYL